MKKLLVPGIIALLLFLIPLFWFKPGELDMGGDSSRLYFYDPLAYIQGQSLYSVFYSGLGEENSSYYGIPFFLFLAALKSVLPSSTMLISVFYGLSLSLGFVFIYFIVDLLLVKDPKLFPTYVRPYAGVLAGLFYVFSPVPILNWGHNISTYNQVFLNPLMFYLILKYFLDFRVRYMVLAIVLSVIFAPNFSIVGAPPFFAFYPISFLFILFYVKWILKRRVPLGRFFGFICLFFLVHAFQLLPILKNIFSPANSISQAIFSKDSITGRGLTYFSAIAPSIRASLNLFALPQLTPTKLYSSLFGVFPFIIVLALIRNKRRSFLLTGLFFLIAFYWETANITQVGFTFYKNLFYLPGFSMFRNYFAQWQYLFLFFYALFIGQALAILGERVSKRAVVVTVCVLGIFLTVTAWPLINGDIVNSYHWTSNNVRIPVVMDPEYEKVLTYFRTLKDEGKIITLPLTDPGYQIIAGKNDGAYVGPSTIAYLAGRQEFSGYNEFGMRFRDSLLSLARSEKFEELKKVLGLLNIRYIFYNSHPRVYEEGFPTFPYNHVREYLPGDQASYKTWLTKLGLTQKLAINDTYFVYELPPSGYLPELFISDQTLYFNRPTYDWTIPFAFVHTDTKRPVFLESNNRTPSVDDVVIEADLKSFLPSIVKNPDLPLVLHYSFVTTRPNSIAYPVIMAKEFVAISLKTLKKNIFTFLDVRMFYSAKRMLELERWGNEMEVLGTVKHITDFSRLFEPKTWITQPREVMNSWEWNFARYYSYMTEAISSVSRAEMSDENRLHQRFLLNEYLEQHKIRLVKTFFVLSKKPSEMTYLRNLMYTMFEELHKQLQFQTLKASEVHYSIDITDHGSTTYQVYVEDRFFSDNLERVQLDLIGESRSYRGKNNLRGLADFGDVSIGNLKGEQNATLRISPPINIMDSAIRIPLETLSVGREDIRLLFDTTFFRGQKGMFWTIPDWKPKDYYLLTFEYKTGEVPFQMKIFDESMKVNGEKKHQEIINESIASPNWATYQAVIRSGEFSSGALLGFVPFPFERSDTSLELRNFTLHQIPFPKVLLHAPGNKPVGDSIAPVITTRKVNPTKYHMHVSGANDAYTIVLNQAFSKNWKVIDPNRSALDLYSRSITIAQRVGTWVLGLIGSPEKHVFQDAALLETWGKSEIAVNSHVFANGNANAWYIRPEDMSGKTEYDLIIEMTSQQVFYKSIFLTLGGLSILIMICLRVWKRKNA